MGENDSLVGYPVYTTPGALLPNPLQDDSNLRRFMRGVHHLDAVYQLRQAKTEIRILERRITELSQMDPLTGLPNHHRFLDRLSQAMFQATRSGQAVGILVVDLDRFKRVNELLGHLGGDEVIQQVAVRLAGALRQGDTLACMGGDRFLVLLPELKEPLGATRMAQRLLESLQTPFKVGVREQHFSACIGVAVHPQDGMDAATLQAHAESAMYRAKERGGNRIECFTTTLNQISLERQELEQCLREAMQNGELQIYYQPQFFMDGRLAGAEALLRWNHPLLGPVPPTKFIPVAEEIRLILPIGAWALREATTQMAKWQTMVPFPLILAVNVSALQFANGDWDDCVLRALTESGLRPECLELELTESLVMRQGHEDIQPLHRLREIGTRIAIDDFGTGYSSLSYLQRLPITTLKIDQSFIASLHAEAPEISSEHIVKAIIQLGHSLNLTIVAEGVETEAQRDTLDLLGCDFLQGFLLGRPLPVDAFEALLASISTKTFLEYSMRPRDEVTAPLPPMPATPEKRSKSSHR